MIKEKIRRIIKDATGVEAVVEKPKSDFGDYATNAAMLLKISGEELISKIKDQISQIKEIERVEAKGGFVNFFLTKDFIQSELKRITQDDAFGKSDSLKDQKIIVEYTDPNPFKLFHIGHMMSNTIGEAIARLHEASGAQVLRVNYQGDVGLHVAKAVWALLRGEKDAYAVGNKAYEENPEAKQEIEEINKKIYTRSDEKINAIYDSGRKESLEYFEKQYQRLGTKFVHYFFESEMGPKGIDVIKGNESVFEKSQGAVVFAGEKYGLHTRVFINSQGLPTYEAKELGLNQEKFKLYNPDLSIIVTANEITEYFKVLMKAMELTMPEVAQRTRHMPHGIMKLPTGKMSSRTGDVITADQFIEQVKEKVGGEEVAIGAIKYSILKQGIGNDIIFDFEKSLAVTGDSGVYLQYTHARLKSILDKASAIDIKERTQNFELQENIELNIIKHLMEFPEAVVEATSRIAPNVIALYLYELSNKTNRFYEEVRILTDEDEERKVARLVLIKTVAIILSRGMDMLGIKAVDQI